MAAVALPEHSDWLLTASITGRGLTRILVLLLLLQPATVTVTVYVPASLNDAGLMLTLLPVTAPEGVAHE
jgi:hypothetical protein